MSILLKFIDGFNAILVKSPQFFVEIEKVYSKILWKDTSLRIA